MLLLGLEERLTVGDLLLQVRGVPLARGDGLRKFFFKTRSFTHDAFNVRGQAGRVLCGGAAHVGTEAGMFFGFLLGLPLARGSGFRQLRTLFLESRLKAFPLLAEMRDHSLRVGLRGGQPLVVLR